MVAGLRTYMTRPCAGASHGKTWHWMCGPGYVMRGPYMGRPSASSHAGVTMSTATQDPEVVVITGASAGVGRATAQAFARRGARIGLLARGREGLEGAS